ncbi:tRNA-dihydrouridine(16/17) synthase [NAD(P)(+)]-like, partial [Araneus ventricosus]
FYGSFLQDDWDLIRSLVQKACYELPVPVTCKMRILPGHFKKSVEYARMLEHAGCSVLTVHGRTREQKGHATGLASWEVIKEIKANVNIPVIANGNILSFDDVEACLERTGADAVMSAEALLHNPALFSGKNPPVWKIVEEYLQLADKYNTPIRCVRCHLFKILYLCIYQDDEVREILTEGSTLADFYSVVEILKKLPAKLSNSEESNAIVKNNDPEHILESINFSFEEFADTNTITQNTIPVVCDNEENSLLHSTRNHNMSDSNENFINNMDSGNDDIRNENEADDTLNYLPIWVCHSRPRVAITEKSRGCFSKYFDSSSEKTNENLEEMYMSKKKQRRARHHERVVAAMKEKRKTKKMRKKQKLAEMKAQEVVSVVEDVSDKKEKVTKKQQKMMIKERLLSAQGTAPKICINLGFASTMETKELSRLSSQLRRLYGSNRHSSNPVHLYFCNFSPADELYKICESKNDGFSSYIVDMTPEAPEDLFNTEDIIYLSPDSDNVLETLVSNKVYVIGGIVDDTVKKDLSLNHAKDFNIKTARLPIVEYLVPYSANPGTTVLTVNQVFDILLKYYETKDWTESLSCNVPLRKGYCAPSKKDDLSQSITDKKLTNCSDHLSTENSMSSIS